MLGRFFKAALIRATESIGAVVLVLVFFVAALGILGLAFPRGTSLKDLVAGSVWTPPEPTPGPLEVRTGPGPAPGPARPAPEPFVARLTDVFRKVKDKPADLIAWGDSRQGTPLEARHAIQTFSRSGATITFDDASNATLGENSLMVIRGEDATHESGEHTVSLLITEGELRTFHGMGEHPMELVTGAGTGRVRGKTPDTDLKVTVNPDHTSTFSVYQGLAEVSEAGKTVNVPANFTVTVAAGKPPGEPQQLPAVPVPTGPASGTVFPFRSVSPQVALTWDGAERAQSYRVEIATDAKFREVLEVLDRLPETRVVHGNLSAGPYYWRVRGLVGWADGLPSAAQKLELIHDAEPPALSVDFPEGTLHEDRLVLRGATEPGALVYVSKEKVETDPAGRFEVALSLHPGVNVVVVEALDAAGNVTYRSGLLDARF